MHIQRISHRWSPRGKPHLLYKRVATRTPHKTPGAIGSGELEKHDQSILRLTEYGSFYLSMAQDSRPNPPSSTPQNLISLSRPPRAKRLMSRGTTITFSHDLLVAELNASSSARFFEQFRHEAQYGMIRYQDPYYHWSAIYGA